MNCQKSRFSAVSMGLTLCFTISIGAQSPQAPDEPWEVRGMGRVIAPLVQASKASVQQTVITRLDSHVSVDVLLDGKRQTLNIIPHSLRSKGCRFFMTDETGRHEIAPPPITTYRGQVAGHPESSVRASLYQDRFSASIDDGAGGRWTIEPAKNFIDNLPGQWSVVYRDADLLDLDISCGVTDENDLLSLEVGGKGLNATSTKAASGINGRTELGIEADNTFFTLFGSSSPATIAAIEERMNIVDYVYRDQVGICYEITGFIIRTTLFAPYDATSTISDLLDAFTADWSINVPNSGLGIQRDMAHLFTNRHPAPGTVGSAWVGVICLNPFSYGVSNDLSTLRLDWLIVAHEMGHNWSAGHCDGDADCSIMLPSLNTVMIPTFGAASTTSITSHQASRTCLSVCAVPDPCAADSNGDNTINVTDLLALLANWGTCAIPCLSDTNVDGSVNVTDLLALLAAWGACP